MSTKETFPPVENLRVVNHVQVVLVMGGYRYTCYLTPNNEWAIYRGSQFIFTWHPIHKHITNLLRLAL